MPGPRSLEYGRIGEKPLSTDAYGTAATSFSVLMADEYTVEPENVVVNQEKFTGANETTNQDIERQDLRGSLTMQIWPDNVTLSNQLAGINTSAGNGSSRLADGSLREYTVQWFDSPKGEYLRHVGLMADTVRIQIRPNESLRYVYDLVGQGETLIASFPKPTFITYLPFKMSHAHTSSGGAAGMYVETGGTDAAPTAVGGSNTGDNEPNLIEANIEIRNNLAPSEPRNNNMQILWIDPGRRDITLTCRVRTNSDMARNYRDAVRLRKTDFSWAFVFQYPGTGSPVDRLTLRLDRASIVSARRTGGVTESQVLDLQFECAAPTANDGIIYATT